MEAGMAKGPGGRPTKYRPEYCDMIVAHMEDGASVLSFAASIDVSRSVINLWASEHPEFMQALARAKAKSAAWWEAVGRNIAVTGEGNASMAIFGLKNMAGDEWADTSRTELTGKDGSPLNVQIVRYGYDPPAE